MRAAAIGMICAGMILGNSWADNPPAPLPAQPPEAQPFLGADEMTEPQVRASLSVLDGMLQALLKARAAVPAMLPNAAKDERGRIFADDWQAFCLNDADQADIHAQFAGISAALDAADLKSANHQRAALFHRLEVMGIQCKCIGDYWQDVVLHPPNWAPYLAMLRDNSVEPHYAVNIASLERTLKLQASHGLFIDAIGGTLTQLEGIRARAQQRDIKQLRVKAMDPAFRGLYPMTQATTCTPVATKSSGSETPSLDYSQPRAKLIYPEGSRRNREHGVVSVGIIVTPAGCVRAGFVLGSSGYEQLDRAAVSYAMQMRLLPAEADGVSIEALAVAPVTFVLQSQ